MRGIVQRSLLPLVLGVLVVALWLSGEVQEIAAGVAIFLFGMLMLEQGFTLVGSGVLERALRGATRSVSRSVGFGALATTAMQSSTLVSVITISFLSAGLIPLVSGIGIVFGANLGSTTGAWLIAGLGLRIHIAALAMPMLAVAIVLVFNRSKGVSGAGYVLGGVGFLFLGIHFMKEGFDSFAEQFDLSQFALGGVVGLLVYTLVGFVATAVMQSSHATLVLVITALAAGQLTYDNALAIAIGANVGSTVTAVIGAATANYQGRRLAGGHVIFNVVTAAAALLLIVPLQGAVAWISDLAGIGADDHTLRLAVFHTMFNILGLLIMIPALPLLLRALERIFPTTEPQISEPQYLSESIATFPETLQTAVANEVEHLYANATDLIAEALGLDRDRLVAATDVASYVRSSRTPADLDMDLAYEQRIKPLHGAILDFVSRRTAGDIPAGTARRLTELRIAAERIVRSVKEVKHLRRNTLRYTSSDQGVVTRVYDDLRIHIARTLRELDDLARSEPESRSILSLEEARDRVRTEKRLVRPLVEELLRRDHLDAGVATSFINDASYGYRAMKEMLEGAQALYSEPLGVRAEVERLLAMDEDSLDDDDD